MKDPTTATGSIPFNSNVSKLVNMISNSAGNPTSQISTLKDQLTEATNATEPNAITAADLRGYTYQKTSGQSIVVRLGGLDWIVTYVTTDITNQNVIATLWLSDNYQEAWGYDPNDSTAGTNQTLGDYCSLTNGGLFSSFATNRYDYVYGLSYVRVEALNNPTNRIYGLSSGFSSTIAQKTSLSEHPLALFTVDSFKLTDYLAMPYQMKWMTNRQSSTLKGCNEALTTNNAYNYEDNSSYSDKSSSEYYANWGEDYLWLPSLPEIGGYASAQGESGWLVNANEKYNGQYVWLRNHVYVVAGAQGVSCIAPDSVTNYYALASNQGVRPAMLFNLTEAMAHSQLESITITLDKAGGSGGTSSVGLIRGQTLPSLTQLPTRPGAIFGGYYTQANGQGTKIYNADGTPAVTTSSFDADTTLYAYWKPYFDVEMTGATFTSKQVFDAERINATLKITPQTGYRVSEISFDNTNWTDIEYCNFSFGNTAFAMNITYFANEQSNVFALDFRVLLHDFDTLGSIPIYLKTASGAYSGLKNSGSVSGVVVTATLGGMAYIVGDDFENLGDSDTITVSTKLCQSGYTFVGWYLDDDRTTAVSTATSYRVTKSVAYEHTLVAVYQPTSDSGVNVDVDNSG